MINWNQLNAGLRRALRVMPACGTLILIASVVLAVFERSMQTALTGIALGLIVLELGFLALRPEGGADVKPEPRPELPAPAPEPAQAKPSPHRRCIARTAARCASSRARNSARNAASASGADLPLPIHPQEE